jgi:hypothetical protein
MPTTYEPIATTTLGSAAASITFSSIASSWTDLRISFVIAGGSGTNAVGVRFNSDSTTSYSRTSILADGSTATSARNTTTRISYPAALGATYPEFFTMDIFSYTGSTFKTVLGVQSADRNGTGYTGSLVGLWSNTAAITAIEIYQSGGTFAAGTTATLYGIKNA